MVNKGWIALHREITDNWIWKEKEPFDRRSAWIDLILMVNHEDKKIMFNGNLIVVKRGQKITSISKLSERWNWSRGKAKRFLEALQEDEMISLEIGQGQYTTITIENYSFYQDVKKVNGQVTDKSMTSDGQVTDINNNDITMINNDNNDDDNKNINLYIKELQNVTGKKSSSTQIKKIFEKHGADNMHLLLAKIKESKYLQKNINLNRLGEKFLNKVFNDDFKDFEVIERKKKNTFNNFEQITDNYSDDELENVAMQKQREAFKKLGID